MEILQGFYWSLPFLGEAEEHVFWNPSSLNPANVSITMHVQISSSGYMNTQMLKTTVSPKGEPTLKDMPSPTFGPIFCMGSSLLKWTPTLECASSLIYVHFRAYDTQGTWHTTPAWSHRRVWSSLHNSKELTVSDESFLRQSQAILCQSVCEIKGY